MSRIYLLILERIEQRRFDVWGKRISVSGAGKALIACSVWFKYKLMGGAG
jgi:hypothetical protein